MTTNARLRALVELADTGSVRGAAERLFVTESAISSAVSNLSSEVGVSPIERRGRGVHLTTAGHRYVQYARQILGLHDESILAARGEADPEHGSIRLAAVTTAGELLIPAVLASFWDQYPGVVCKLEVVSRTRSGRCSRVTRSMWLSRAVRPQTCATRRCRQSVRTPW